MDKSNITLKIDADLLREAKVLAARRGTSVSRMVAAELEKLVRQDQEYESARQRAVQRLHDSDDLGWIRPKSRDELHDR